MSERDHVNRLHAAGLARAAGLGWAAVTEQICKAVRTKPRIVPRRVTAPKPNILILTPSHDGRFPSQYVDALMSTRDFLDARGIAWGCRTANGNSLLPAARSLLAAHFLAHPQFTHALWIDADVEWQPADLLRLVAHDVDLVAGTYREKREEVRWEFRASSSAGPDPEAGLIDVERIGFGFVLSRRSVFERLAAVYPERKIRP